MKKNNKGFFLAETIVMIALISTVMAFVYPNVSKLYENYKNKTVYYDQTEDIYALKAIYEYLLNNNEINELTESGCKIFSNEMIEMNVGDIVIDGLTNLYITGYMSKPSNVDYEFNKYLNHLKKTTYDTTAYRLIGVFEKGEEGNKKIKYASIKIDNPNLNRDCNLGGDISDTAS